eukprot:CAMPEP_0202896522 /NCGR_PEP_ID=MMETSP1392-20130828/5518_1 /ASSEMBLY_ACC=CAM_ASM_000868 /TAXON_ID=225041 /ORGANISM="Chlamydomonas chlamydogama, Strain SAG 11-48b" /LENGTH=366 /DNA_ID=CAMNT_0049581913 /DNA_START=53 /DNA_END=1153 /DNA_ORIENTATION=-
MGRKGMKGFMKSAMKHKDEEEVEEQQQGETNQPASAQQPAKAQERKSAAAPAPAPAPKADEDDGSDDEEEGGPSGPETRGHMIQRHKREMQAHKKNLQRMGKKSKDELAKLNKEIEDRHARELREVEDREAGSSSAAAAAVSTSAEAAEELAEGVAGLDAGGHKKPSKAMKRKEKLAKAEADRAARIAEEQAHLGPSERAREEDQLEVLLKPLGLGIRDIRADGHCMYRAIEDQLQQAGAASPPTFQQLRERAAAHIRAHPDDFMPFIYNEDEDGEPGEQLEDYCAELESTAVWGGQLELGALAQVLKKQIKVHAVGMPPLSLGDEHQGNGCLEVCYLRHAFGLGEHYNSVEKLGSSGDSAAQDST